MKNTPHTSNSRSLAGGRKIFTSKRSNRPVTTGYIDGPGWKYRCSTVEIYFQHDRDISLPKPAYRYLLQGIPPDKHTVLILNKEKTMKQTTETNTFLRPKYVSLLSQPPLLVSVHRPQPSVVCFRTVRLKATIVFSSRIDVIRVSHAVLFRCISPLHLSPSSQRLALYLCPLSPH